MRGTKSKRSENKWRLRVYVGRSPTGSPMYVSQEFTGGSRAADAALRKLVEEATKTTSTDRGSTVADLLERWLEHIGADHAPSTLRSYRLLIAGRINPAFGATRIDRLRVDVIDRQYRRWLSEPRGGNRPSTAGEPLSPATVRQIHAVLKAAFHQAQRWGWIGENPVLRATPPTVDHTQTSSISDGELQAIIDRAEAEDPLLGTAITLAAVIGCRRGELCALRWSDVDWARAQLGIDRAITVLKGGDIVERPTKTHQIRRLALDPLTVGLLRRRRAYQEALALEGGVDLVADPYLLSRRLDGALPCLPGGLTSGFARVSRRLGLPYHFHDLRHFAVTTAIAAGADIRSVGGRAGQADTSVTLKVYAHAVAAPDRAIAELLGGVVLGPRVITAVTRELAN